MKTIVCVIGTRPEVLKMAPVILALRKNPNFHVKTLVTAQHRHLLDQMLQHFDILIDDDFNVMTDNQSLSDLTQNLLKKFDHYLSQNPCDLLVAQGDTTTTMIAALADFYKHIPFAHVEAGLRTDDLENPFPEELNRRVADIVSTLHFCPTQTAKENLLKEGIKDNLYVTGNTIIDTLYLFAAKVEKKPLSHTKTLLVTSHRRENFGEPLLHFCEAFKEIIRQHPEVEIIYPVHPNPNVKDIVHKELAHIERIHLVPPMNYDELVETLVHSYLVLTDSGGLQEEAPALGKPVLILRNETERPEGVTCGAAKLLGTQVKDIVEGVNTLLTNKEIYQKMATAGCPYGDGKASERIATIIENYLSA